MICCFQKYGSTNASSAGGSCNFDPVTDLAISVFREVSIKQCLPESTLLAGVGSEDGSREELACESLHSGTLSSTRFSAFLQPFRYVGI